VKGQAIGDVVAWRECSTVAYLVAEGKIVDRQGERRARHLRVEGSCPRPDVNCHIVGSRAESYRAIAGHEFRMSSIDEVVAELVIDDRGHRYQDGQSDRGVVEAFRPVERFTKRNHLRLSPSDRFTGNLCAATPRSARWDFDGREGS